MDTIILILGLFAIAECAVPVSFMQPDQAQAQQINPYYRAMLQGPITDYSSLLPKTIPSKLQGGLQEPFSESYISSKPLSTVQYPMVPESHLNPGLLTRFAPLNPSPFPDASSAQPAYPFEIRNPVPHAPYGVDPASGIVSTEPQWRSIYSSNSPPLSILNSGIEYQALKSFGSAFDSLAESSRAPKQASPYYNPPSANTQADITTAPAVYIS